MANLRAIPPTAALVAATASTTGVAAFDADATLVAGALAASLLVKLWRTRLST